MILGLELALFMLSWKTLAFAFSGIWEVWTILGWFCGVRTLWWLNQRLEATAVSLNLKKLIFENILRGKQCGSLG